MNTNIAKFLFAIFLFVTVACGILLFPMMFYKPDWAEGQFIALLVVGVISAIGTAITGILAGRGKKK